MSLNMQRQTTAFACSDVSLLSRALSPRHPAVFPGQDVSIELASMLLQPIDHASASTGSTS